MNTYLGGARPRGEAERATPGAPRRRPGLLVADLDGTMIGLPTLTRNTGHLKQAAGTVELGARFAGSPYP